MAISIAAAPWSNEVASEQAQLLKALSSPVRLRILALLKQHQGDICVDALVANFTLEQPTVSHHLQILLKAGLVGRYKEGLFVYYYVRDEALGTIRAIIEGMEG